jgi:hypothetical protein
VTVPDAVSLDEMSDEDLLGSVHATVEGGEVASRILPHISKELSENILAAIRRGDRDAVVTHVQIAALTSMGAYSLYVGRISELYDEVQKRGIQSEDVVELEEILAKEYAAASRLDQKIHEAEQEALKALPEGPEKEAVVYSLEELRRRKVG